MLYKKKRNETYQLRASIFDTPIEHLCIVVADATGRAHVPEVLFSVKNFLLQYNALLVLQHLRAPPAESVRTIDAADGSPSESSSDASAAKQKFKDSHNKKIH